MKLTVNILRHAIAEEAKPGLRDADRALTAAGKRKLAIVLKRARAAGVAPATILSSPLRRAVETAAIVVDALGVDDEVKLSDALLPAAPPADTWKELKALAERSEVIVIGHEPHLSRLTAFLLGSERLRLDFKKAGIVRIRMESTSARPHGILEWILTPRLAK